MFGITLLSAGGTQGQPLHTCSMVESRLCACDGAAL